MVSTPTKQAGKDDISYVPPSWAQLRVPISSLEEDDRTCRICNLDYGTSENGSVPEHPVRLPSCQHRAHHFGERCLTTWLEYSNVCPTDRQPLHGIPTGQWVVRSRAMERVNRIAQAVICGDMECRRAFFGEGGNEDSEALTAFFELLDGAVLANVRMREYYRCEAHQMCSNHLEHRFQGLWPLLETVEFGHLVVGSREHETAFVTLMRLFHNFPYQCWPGAETAFWSLLEDARFEIAEADDIDEIPDKTDMGVKIALLRFLMTFMTDDSKAWIPSFDSTGE